MSSSQLMPPFFPGGPNNADSLDTPVLTSTPSTPFSIPNTDFFSGEAQTIGVGIPADVFTIDLSAYPAESSQSITITAVYFEPSGDGSSDYSGSVTYIIASERRSDVYLVSGTLFAGTDGVAGSEAASGDMIIANDLTGSILTIQVESTITDDTINWFVVAQLVHQ